MLVDIVKPFPFSRDGVTLEQAVEGALDLPDALVPGLEAEGYVNKAQGGAPENKGSDPFSREAIEALTDKAEIVALLEAHSIDADKRKSVETLRAELLAAMFVEA